MRATMQAAAAIPKKAIPAMKLVLWFERCIVGETEEVGSTEAAAFVELAGDDKVTGTEVKREVPAELPVTGELNIDSGATVLLGAGVSVVVEFVGRSTILASSSGPNKIEASGSDADAICAVLSESDTML